MSEQAEEALETQALDRYECRACGYVYEPEKGDDKYDIPAGTDFKDLPINWKCPVCNEPLYGDEKLETHHIVPVASGGSDDHRNLQHLHKACHKQVHSKSKRNRSK